MLTSNQDEKTQKAINKALERCRKEIDKVFIGKTPKMTSGMDQIYDCDIYIFRHPGMGNSKQVISAKNEISIWTATGSYLESLLRQGILDEKQLKDLVKMSIKAAKGQLE